MPRLFLVHWNEQEAYERAETLRRAGHEVRLHWNSASADMRTLREDPPDAVVIDLRRLPSHGRGWAVALRRSKSTREIPLVLIEGDEIKTRRIREALPDATFTPWSRVRSALRAALRHPPTNPVVPGTMDAYAGTPLPRKLGVVEGTRLALLDAPDGFDGTLTPLPVGVTVRRRARGESSVVMLFVRDAAALHRRWPAAAATVAPGGRLWIAWPKRNSALAGDLGADQVRSCGLRHGWVDFKIAAIDSTWSGLCFSRRKTTPAGRPGGKRRRDTTADEIGTPTSSRGSPSRPRRKR